MSMIPVRALAWIFVSTGLAAGIQAMRTPAVAPPEIQPPRPVPAAHELQRSFDLDSIAVVVRTRDPFRRSRHPSPAPAAGVQGEVMSVSDNRAQTVAIVWPELLGVVGGSTPSAVLRGLAGIDGTRVARPGDVFGDLTVTRIWGDSVEVSVTDSVVVLKLRRAGR